VKRHLIVYLITVPVVTLVNQVVMPPNHLALLMSSVAIVRQVETVHQVHAHQALANQLVEALLT
jgi:hypothetical protein